MTVQYEYEYECEAVAVALVQYYWCGTTKKRIPNFLQNAKIVINGSPRGRFEHLGLETA